MNRTLLLLLFVVALPVAPACNDHDHPHAATESTDGEPPTVAVSRWTDRSELFMEYPVFVAGATGRFAIHVTDLADFTPLTEGDAVVVMRGAEDGRAQEFRGGVSRPGIYGVDVMIEEPGFYEMSLRVDSPGLQDLHELGPVTVHAPGEPFQEAGEEQEAISFLKEQQWTLEFGTEPVEIRELQSSITVPASIRPRPGGEATLSAPVPGRIDPSSTVPVPGTRVRAGADMARIVPHSDSFRDVAGLRAELVEAEQQYELARQEHERAARLVEARALPARRLAEAQSALVTSEARLDAARQRLARFDTLSQTGVNPQLADSFAVRAPFDGVVAEVRFTPGSSVEEGETLARVVDVDRVHVVGTLPESRAAVLRSVGTAELLETGVAVSLPLGRPLAVGNVVDPASRTVEVRFALDNREPRLPVGRGVHLRLLVGGTETYPAVPESAVVDDAGRPVVFVQTGGESFARRAVQLGSREAGYVHVLEGVAPGERVVSRGAYLIRLAAMSTQIPAHGHVH
jgi:RND family efflux transporter MFP subunit